MAEQFNNAGIESISLVGESKDEERKTDGVPDDLPAAAWTWPSNRAGKRLSDGAGFYRAGKSDAGSFLHLF